MAYKSGDGAVTRRVLLTLDDATLEVFRAAGDGNASLGARRLAKKQWTGAATDSIASAAGASGGAGAGAVVGGAAARRALERKCRALMQADGLTLVGGAWRRGANRLSVVGERALYAQHPELREYAALHS